MSSVELNATQRRIYRRFDDVRSSVDLIGELVGC